MSKAPKKEKVFEPKGPEAGFVDAIRARVSDKIREVKGKPGKHDRSDAVKQIQEDLIKELAPPVTDPNASYTSELPAGHNAFAYVYQGDAKIGAASTAIARGELALLTQGETLPVTAGTTGARLIVVAARPLNEPVARYGPFVMNTPDEIRQAFADYQAGRL